MGAIRPTIAAQLEPPSRHRSLRDVRLFVAAFRLAGQAQVVARAPLPEVVARLLALGGLPRGADPDAAWVAAARGSRYRARWRGGLDTCLVRTLVAGALLADREGVVLRVGFRSEPTSPARPDGHAWLVVGDSTLGEAPGMDRACYCQALDLPMRRREGLR